MPGWVEQHSYVLLRLVLCDSCPERHCLGDSRVKVINLKVEMHHRTLLSRQRGPYGGFVVRCLLEDHVHGPFRRREDRGPLFLVGNPPAEQLRVEVRQGAWVG